SRADRRGRAPDRPAPADGRPTGVEPDGRMARCPPPCPPGAPAPPDGALPESALADLGDRPFGLYVHVPFCAVRCGYCDFNTYTAEELGGAATAPGASRTTYAQAAVAEVRRARQVLGD